MNSVSFATSAESVYTCGLCASNQGIFLFASGAKRPVVMEPVTWNTLMYRINSGYGQYLGICDSSKQTMRNLNFVKEDDAMKKKWFVCGLICMLILSSIAQAENISASLSGQIWNLDLTRSPMAYTDEGTIVLAGSDGNASTTADTIEAR